MANLGIQCFWRQSSRLLIFTTIMLSACHDSDAIPNVDENNKTSNRQVVQAIDQGKKLTDVAGKPTMPIADPADATGFQVPENAKKYIGRYRVEVSCNDAFVECDTGMSEFILNLLADGSAHRMFIHLGKVTYATSSQYRQDHWYFDAEAHEIVLHRASGVEFYYRIDQKENLIMNLDKMAIATQQNRKYFATGNALPVKAYTLSKIIED